MVETETLTDLIDDLLDQLSELISVGGDNSVVENIKKMKYFLSKARELATIGKYKETREEVALAIIELANAKRKIL